MNEIVKYDKSLTHYGILRRSGRYPWGSGENSYQRSGDFLSRVNSLLDKGMTEAEIAQLMPEEIRSIMDKIVAFDKLSNNLKSSEG